MYFTVLFPKRLYMSDPTVYCVGYALVMSMGKALCQASIHIYNCSVCVCECVCVCVL